MTLHPTSHRGALIAVGGLLAALSLGGVAQAITDSGFRYSSPKAGSLMLSVGDFVSRSNTSPYSITDFIISTSSPTQVCFNAPVHLPQGATITHLKAYYVRPAVSDLLAVFLRRNNFSVTDVQIVANEAQAQAPVTAGGIVTYAANPATNVVRNGQYAYFVGLCMTQNTQFMNARVDYTVTNAGD